MHIGSHETDERVFIIAEIGNNHEGDFGLAREMVAAAAEAGVDAVKFQTFRTEHFVSRDNPDRMAMLKRFELTFDQFAELKSVADDNGVQFISTPLDLESARFLNEIVPAFKIASGDNTFYPLMEAVAGYGKPILLSCGLLDRNSLIYAAALIRRVWAAKGVDPGLAALQCVTSYPVPPECANLAAIRPIAEAAGAEPGYSDHTMGIEAAVLSVACGARVVEKHFTLDKNHSAFRDHQLSADTVDMARLVGRIREAEVLLGSGVKEPAACELDIRSVVRRSAVYARAMQAGEAVRMADITWVRPAGGYAPGQEGAFLGMRLNRAVEPFTLVAPDDFE